MLPIQDGYLLTTFAETRDLQFEFGFAPSALLQEGVHKFVTWYIYYHGIKK